MDKIEVMILDHNLNGMPKFLARLTQRGHLINSMADVQKLYIESVPTAPSERLMTIPHSTIRRMNYLTVAITGLSTKAVSQLRTHAKRLTFVSTSTQYSSYEGREDNYVIPVDAGDNTGRMREAFAKVHEAYKDLIAAGVDKDTAGYLLPQGLRKAVVISGNLDDWQYVMRTRLCNRNTKEVQYIMQLIYDKIVNICGADYTAGMLPSCVEGKCQEGKFSCGVKYEN